MFFVVKAFDIPKILSVIGVTAELAGAADWPGPALSAQPAAGWCSWWTPSFLLPYLRHGCGIRREALNQTNELLSRDRVTIFEAAFRFGNHFIRADILVKNGNHLDLIEVKSKSFDISSDSFFNRNGFIYAKWQPYLYDVAFQRYVIANALPQYSLCAHLMMVDKNAPLSHGWIEPEILDCQGWYRKKRSLHDKGLDTGRSVYSYFGLCQCGAMLWVNL